MKKLLVIAIAAFAFTACNNGAKEGDGKAADSTSAQTPTEQPTTTPTEGTTTTPAEGTTTTTPAEGTTTTPAEGTTTPPAATDKAAH